MSREVFVLCQKLGQRNLVPVYVCACFYYYYFFEGGCLQPFGSQFFFLPSASSKRRD